jgi:hypothetical protein
MKQTTRVLIAIIILFALVGVVLGVDAIQRRVGSKPTEDDEIVLTPGSVPIYTNDQIVGAFTPDDLSELEEVSFVDAEEEKQQKGWMLRDVLRLKVDDDTLEHDTSVTVSSSSRGKSVQLSWEEIDQLDNYVLFDLSSRGTLKLVSVLEKLDTRDKWIQDVDKIEIYSP